MPALAQVPWACTCPAWICEKTAFASSRLSGDLHGRGLIDLVDGALERRVYRPQLLLRVKLRQSGTSAARLLMCSQRTSSITQGEPCFSDRNQPPRSATERMLAERKSGGVSSDAAGHTENHLKFASQRPAFLRP